MPAGGNTQSGTIGDGNSEVYVNAVDFGIFKAAYGSESDIASPVYNPFMDFNLDGYITSNDFVAFKQTFNTDCSF